MRPTLKDLINSQSWIEEAKKSPAAMRAFRLWQAFMVPTMIQARLKVTADSAKVPYEDVALMNLAYESSMIAVAGLPHLKDFVLSMISCGMPATRWGCSCFAVVEDIGGWQIGAIHGRNLDWPDPGHLLRDSTTVSKEGGPTPYYTVGFPGQAGVITGSANHRFSISLNAVYTEKVGWGYAPVYLIRKVLDECKNFDEALRMICKTKLMVGALFLLMDGGEHLCKTRMVVIERTPDKYYIRRQREYGNTVSAVICTNDYLGIKPESAGVINTGEELQQTSCGRYRAIERELRENENIHKDDQILKILKQGDVKLPCTIHSVLMCPTFGQEPEVYVP